MGKLFAFDMDGTILDSNNKVKQATINAIKKGRDKGHKFIIATGRPFKDALRDISGLENYIDYIIANNGTYHVKMDESKFIYSGEVPQEFVQILANIAIEEKCFMAVHGSEEAQRSFPGNDGLDGIDWDSEDYVEFKQFKDKFISYDEMVKWCNSQHICQVSLRSDRKTIEKIQNEFQQYSDTIEVHIANDVYLDVNPKGISKISGIENVAYNLGYTLEDVVAFGDSGNDLQMLEHSGLGICMGNGNVAAKAISDIVIGSNNTDAIGNKILEIIND